jgi:hypothetical protein
MEHGAPLTTRQNGEMIEMSPRTEGARPGPVRRRQRTSCRAAHSLMVHEKPRPAGRRAVPVTGATLLAVASVVLAYSANAA